MTGGASNISLWVRSVKGRDRECRGLAVALHQYYRDPTRRLRRIQQPPEAASGTDVCGSGVFGEPAEADHSNQRDLIGSASRSRVASSRERRRGNSSGQRALDWLTREHGQLTASRMKRSSGRHFKTSVSILIMVDGPGLIGVVVYTRRPKTAASYNRDNGCGQIFSSCSASPPRNCGLSQLKLRCFGSKLPHRQQLALSARR